MASDDDDPRAPYKVYEGDELKGTYATRAEARRAQQRLESQALVQNRNEISSSETTWNASLFDRPQVIRSKATEFRYEREATSSEGWSVPGQAQSTTAGNAGKASRESLTLKRPVWIALRTRTFPQVRRGQGVVATRLRSPAWVWLLLTAVDLSLCRCRH